MIFNTYSLKILSFDSTIMLIAFVYAISGFTEDTALIANANIIMTFQMIALINKERFIKNKIKKKELKLVNYNQKSL